MRITRKVFSIYSEDELISAIEEKAFNEGYQAAQKDEKGSSTRSKVLGYGALGSGAVALGAGGYGVHQAYQGTKNIYKGIDANKLSESKAEELINNYTKAIGRGDKKAQQEAEKIIKSQLGEHGEKYLKNVKKFVPATLASGAGTIGAGVLGVGYGVSRYFDKKKKKNKQ